MKLVVGPWLVDSSQNYITNIETNQVVKLEPRAMSVLVYFVQRPDQVISRDELIENIWKGRVVSDHAIYRVVNQIRNALDEDDKEVYLTTLPKKGYKLVKPVANFVEQAEEANAPKTHSEIGLVTASVTSPVRPNNVKTLPEPAKYGIFFGLILLGLFMLWKTVLEAKWDYFQTELYTQIKPLNTNNLYEDYPSFTRDGEYLVYTAKNPENPNLNIVLKNIASNTLQQITSDNFNWVNPIASNGAEKIVAIKKDEEGCKVALLFKKIDKYSHKTLFDCTGNEDLSIDINSTGTVIYYTYSDSINPLRRIFSYQIKNGKREQLTNYVEQPALGDFKLALSPDNKFLAFLRSINSKKTYIGVIDLSNNSEKIKLELNSWVSSFGWDSSSDAIIYQDNTTSINKFSIKYDYVKPIISSTSNIIRSAKSIIGKKIAIVQQEKEQYVLWKVFNPLTKNSRNLSKVERIRFSDSVEYFPKYANQSNSIAFMSVRSGSQQIWIKKPNGDLKQLTNFTDGRFVHHLEWSPDDKYIASSSFISDKVYIVNTETGYVRVLLTDESYTNAEVPTWSADGKYIYFSSDKEDTYDMYQISLADNTIVKHTDFGVDWLFEISDEIDIYIKANEQGLWLKKSGENEKLIHEEVQIDSYQSVIYRNNFIYFFNHNTNEFSSYDLKNKILSKSDLALSPSSSSAHITVSSDGIFIVFSEILSEKSKIYTVTP